MLFISTRRELSNEDEIGSTTYWEFTVENQVEIVELRAQLQLEQVLSRLEGKSVLVLVHGYNNELEDIVRAYDLIQSKVGRFLNEWYDEVVGFTWPGGDNPIDWYAPKRRAGVIGPRLARFLTRLSHQPGSIDVMSHSLGARVVCSALNVLQANTVRANFLTASAIDNEAIELGNQYFPGIQRAASESVVFHSRFDGVLKSAYRIAEWDNPLGLFGPENPASVIEHLPNTFVANCKNVIRGHGEYKASDAVYQFIKRWLEGKVTTQFSTVI